MITSKTLEPEIYASCILRQLHYMVIKSYIYPRKNFRKFFLQLVPTLTLLLYSNSFIMVFNMRVVPVFMLQMTSISGLSIISCYCAIKSKRYSIISSCFLSSLSMNLRSSKEDIRQPRYWILDKIPSIDDRKITECQLPTARQLLYCFSSADNAEREE